MSGTVRELGHAPRASNLRLSGPRTPDGALRIGRKTITGVLGGQPVRSRVPGAAAAAAASAPGPTVARASCSARCSGSPSARGTAHDVRLAAALLAAARGRAAAPPSGPRGAHFERCGASCSSCARVSVPLDRTGATPRPHVAVREADQAQRRPRRGALFVLAGGPGQSATEAFEGDGLACSRRPSATAT